MRAKRATFTFWVAKSSLKMPKMVNFGEFLKTWIFRSNRITRQVIFNWKEIGGKCYNWKIKNATFLVIFKHCALSSSLWKKYLQVWLPTLCGVQSVKLRGLLNQKCNTSGNWAKWWLKFSLDWRVWQDSCKSDSLCDCSWVHFSLSANEFSR